MNFGDPSTFGTEMADRFVASGANLPPPVSDRVNVYQEGGNCFQKIRLGRDHYTLLESTRCAGGV